MDIGHLLVSIIAVVSRQLSILQTTESQQALFIQEIRYYQNGLMVKVVTGSIKIQWIGQIINHAQVLIGDNEWSVNNQTNYS